MTVQASARVEVQLSPGVWTDITGDVLVETEIRWSRGIRGSGPTDRVASTGTLECSLRNDAESSERASRLDARHPDPAGRSVSGRRSSDLAWPHPHNRPDPRRYAETRLCSRARFVRRFRGDEGAG